LIGKAKAGRNGERGERRRGLARGRMKRGDEREK
jgi:hypothetical protein